MTVRIGRRDTPTKARYRSNVGPKGEIIKGRPDAGLPPTSSLDPPSPSSNRRAHVQYTHGRNAALHNFSHSPEQGR